MSIKIGKKDLAAWRKRHFEELETCMTVAKSIRDDPEAGAKERIEAVKIIARLLSALAPEKEDKAKVIQSSGRGKAALDPDLQARLDKLIGTNKK